MTISTSNESPLAGPPPVDGPRRRIVRTPGDSSSSADAPARSLWGRFIILVLCLAVVLSALAFGTVHAWSLAVFQIGAAVVVLLWVMDAWRTRSLRLSRNALQWPLVGLILVGIVQLLPLGAQATPTEAARSLSFDPYATRFVLVQLFSLLVYFAAALAFIDTPPRLRLVVRVCIIFGFVLAMFGLMQHFLNPYTIYWVREPKYAQPFGPFINRHHFAGYMELALALPLGLLFTGAVERDRIPLYGFAVALMGIALVMTNSRGGMLSMMAEVLFLVVVAASTGRRHASESGEVKRRGRGVRAAALRVGVGAAILITIFMSVLYFGGDEALSRLVGTVKADDPTTGRTHFWKGAVEIIKDHPVLGVGLGAFSAVYPRYDVSSGNSRLEQAHNDYLQIMTDAGAVGALLGLVFLALLFRQAFLRLSSPDKFRRGVALGALAGCFGVLVHSFFDFTLHTTANAIFFLVLAALATMNGRVEEAELKRHRRRRRRPGVAQPPLVTPAPPAPPSPGEAGDVRAPLAH